MPRGTRPARVDRGERRGHDDAAGQALHDAGGKQHGAGRRCGGQDAADEEHGETREVRTTRADPVGHVPRGDDDRRPGEREQHADVLQRGEAEVEIGRHLREDQVHDRHVHDDERHAERERDEPCRVAAGEGVRWCCGGGHASSSRIGMLCSEYSPSASSCTSGTWCDLA
jgi:hypothetical protein